MTEYRVSARRIDSHGSLAVAKEAEVVLDTDLAGRRGAGRGGGEPRWVGL